MGGQTASKYLPGSMVKTTHRHFSVKNCFRSVFSTTFFLQLLLFLLSNPFRTRNLNIFDPPEPSKSSIFIERVVIFEISTFSVRMPSFLLLGNLLASILVPFQASWGGLGAILGASWGLPGGFLGVSWGFLVESWARELPKGIRKGLLGPPGTSPGASGKPPEGLLGVS